LSKKENSLQNLLHGEMGPNALWLAEALCQVTDLTPDELRQLRAGGGRYLGFVRMLAQRRPG
jgi:hypothetical protein